MDKEKQNEIEQLIMKIKDNNENDTTQYIVDKIELTNKQIEQIINLSIKHNNIFIFEKLLSNKKIIEKINKSRLINKIIKFIDTNKLYKFLSHITDSKIIYNIMYGNNDIISRCLFHSLDTLTDEEITDKNEFVNLVKFLKKIRNENNISLVKNIFEKCYNNNKLEYVKIIFDIFKFDVETYVFIIFKKCILSIYEPLDVFKWSYSLLEQIDFDIHQNYEVVFKYLCVKNKLKTAKWIYYEIGNVNFRINHDYIFRICCNIKENLEVVKWLCSLCDEYYIEIDENNRIENFFIKNIYNNIIEDKERLTQIIKRLKFNIF